MQDRDKDLPGLIAIFPLRGASLYPRARLPLNIFEPRYLAMIEYALGQGRLIGMISPRYDGDVNPPLYDVGCVGRIVSFSETPDARLLVELAGVSRFRLLSDHLTDGNFRLGEVDWGPYSTDLASPHEDTDSLRQDLLDHLGHYLKTVGLSADWESIEGSETEAIVNSVAMSCPFDADEKQALLEAPTLIDRIHALTSLMEIASAEALENDTQDTISRIQ